MSADTTSNSPLLDAPSPDDGAPTADVATPAGSAVSDESRNWAVAGHLSALVVFLGIPSFIGPLAVMMMRRDDDLATSNAREAINFNLSFLIYAVVAAMSMIVLIGFLALPAVLVTWFVLVIVGAVETSNGRDYRYPMTIRFLD